jgi:hypothetical protein
MEDEGAIGEPHEIFRPRLLDALPQAVRVPHRPRGCQRPHQLQHGIGQRPRGERDADVVRLE